ncbi:MAG: 2-phospho-L-lactate guanylyltransferase [Anaerolineales bacterium]|jgi:2-phospho-L-lactate guanylyltransferase|nr:2-phospho-L-lactate guanylyltransferase [Anaerolineales bacterium]
MSIWAIVPVKPLRLGKSRLSGVLSDDERSLLNRMFLENALDILRAVPRIGQTLVVSRDPQALAIAREFGARTVLEDGTPNLNNALQRATLLAHSFNVNGILILPADLPLLAQADIESFIAAHANGSARRVTICSDRHGDGTNALLVSPPGLISYKYGPKSFTRHCEMAHEKNARLKIVSNPNLALDLDTPADLDLFNSIKANV